MQRLSAAALDRVRRGTDGRKARSLAGRASGQSPKEPKTGSAGKQVSAGRLSRPAALVGARTTLLTASLASWLAFCRRRSALINPAETQRLSQDAANTQGQFLWHGLPTVKAGSKRFPATGGEAHWVTWRVDGFCHQEVFSTLGGCKRGLNTLAGEHCRRETKHFEK